MTFERSASGQGNRALFHDKDVVCYVEGGDGGESGIDVLFWSSIFDSVYPNVRIHFICKGGKPVLQSLADRIVREDIGNTIVAMDSDYCRLLDGNYIDDRRVFYTFGYSLENDLYASEYHIDLYSRIAMRANVGADRSALLQSLWAEFLRTIKWPVFGDFYALVAGGSAFDRERPGRYVRRCPANGPKFSPDTFMVDLKRVANDRRAAPRRSVIGAPASTERYVVGKLVELAVRYLFSRVLDEFQEGRDLRLAEMRHIAVSTLSRFVSINSPTGPAAFHRSQLERIRGVSAFQ